MSRTEEDKFMERCLYLATRGAGYVSPNPLVGCVIVKNGEIISEGWHKIFGGNHAEIDALNSAKRKNKSVKGASLYVNLEPCSHYGKTPPCVDMIIKEKIKKVYIGIKDPNKKVNGNGIKKLIDNGIEVKYNILKNECEKLNKFFISYILKKRPYVTLKIAQSIDGNIALKNYKSKWITGNESRMFVQGMRSIYDCVLVGRNTVEKDNPGLRVYNKKFRDPFRIIIDANSKLNNKYKVFKNDDGKSIRITTKPVKYDYDVRLSSSNNSFNISKLLNKIYEMDFSSIMVEGGSITFKNFLKSGLFDDIYYFVSSKILGDGIRTFDNFVFDSLNKNNKLKISSVKQIGNDVLIIYNK